MVFETFVKQLDGCTYCSGGLNCTCACEAMWLYRASQGKIHTSACHVRSLTGDKSGGTHLGQMEQVSIQYGITTGRVYRPSTWSAFVSLISTGRYGAHLNISYRSISGSKYDCFSGRFKGNHDYYISGPGTTGTLRVGDPGADGRRSGIPSGYQNIPLPLLRKAAGQLDIGGRVLGDGLAYVYVTPPDPSTASPHYSASIIHPTKLWNDSTKRWVYSSDPRTNADCVHGGLEVRSATYTKGGTACYPVTSGACSNDYAGYYVPKANVKLGSKC